MSEPIQSGRERVETDAVLVRHSGRLLRLPVSEKSVRLRLPL